MNSPQNGSPAIAQSISAQLDEDYRIRQQLAGFGIIGAIAKKSVASQGEPQGNSSSARIAAQSSPTLQGTLDSVDRAHNQLSLYANMTSGMYGLSLGGANIPLFKTSPSRRTKLLLLAK